MPSDITGTELLEEDHATGKRVFKFVKGPIFGNVVLADEINRAPPKTQAALLQAMQERTVTVAGQTYKLPAPFFVLATQNPIDRKPRIRCRKRSSTGSCSSCGCTIRPSRRKSASCRGRRPTPRR